MLHVTHQFILRAFLLPRLEYSLVLPRCVNAAVRRADEFSCSGPTGRRKCRPVCATGRLIRGEAVNACSPLRNLPGPILLLQRLFRLLRPRTSRRRCFLGMVPVSDKKHGSATSLPPTRIAMAWLSLRIPHQAAPQEGYHILWAATCATRNIDSAVHKGTRQPGPIDDVLERFLGPAPAHRCARRSHQTHRNGRSPSQRRWAQPTLFGGFRCAPRSTTPDASGRRLRASRNVVAGLKVGWSSTKIETPRRSANDQSQCRAQRTFVLPRGLLKQGRDRSGSATSKVWSAMLAALRTRIDYLADHSS